MENNRTIERDFKVNNSLKEINNDFIIRLGEVLLGHVWPQEQNSNLKS